MNKILTFCAMSSLAFLASCSDSDSSSDTFSCDMKIQLEEEGQTYTSHTCVETAESNITAEEKKQCASIEAFGLTATKGDGCPSGATLNCTDTEDGRSFTRYYYGEEFKNLTCDQAADLDIDMGDEDEDEE